MKYALAWIGGILAVAVLGFGIWGVSVLVSGPVGVGNAIKEKNSSQNWTAAQAEFEDNYAEIIAADQKVTLAYTELQADPDDKALQTNYAGTANYCLVVVADYNADARKFLKEEFRSADLPDQISPLDPQTDCKE